eukprot:9634802-Karenia_brevis.AAC.1
MLPHQWRMPWQRPGLVGHAVGGQPLFEGPFSAMRLREISQIRPPPLPEINPAQPHPGDKDEVVEEVPPKRIKVSKAQEEDSRRRKIVESWTKIIGRAPNSSGVGRQAGKGAMGKEEFQESVRLCLAGKATATIAARLSSMMGYISWGHGAGNWPPSEESVYRYLKECAGPGAPPSRASRLIEA